MRDNVLDEFENVSQELPQMLNVLTILTFVGSGLSLLMSLYKLLTKSYQIETLNNTLGVLDQSNQSQFITDTAIKAIEINIDNFTLINSVPIIVGIMCILGAVLMRKLRRNGFYLYVSGCILEIAIPALVIGGTIIGGILLFGSIFSIVFIILYGVNLNHLK